MRRMLTKLIKQALSTEPLQRYAALSEFGTALRKRLAECLRASPAPLPERNSLLFRQRLSLLLGAVVVLLSAFRKLQ